MISKNSMSSKLFGEQKTIFSFNSISGEAHNPQSTTKQTITLFSTSHIPSCHAHPEPTPKETTTPPPVDPTPTVVPLITVSPWRILLRETCRVASRTPNLTFAFHLDSSISDSNSNGSYYYSNDNGSNYYNSGSGSSTYTSPSGSKSSK